MSSDVQNVVGVYLVCSWSVCTYVYDVWNVVMYVQNAVPVCVCLHLSKPLQRLLPAQEGEQFKTDFDGFHMREEMYTNFPDAHFYWRTIFLVVRSSTVLGLAS